jgi:uncharacterized protein
VIPVTFLPALLRLLSRSFHSALSLVVGLLLSSTLLLGLPLAAAQALSLTDLPASPPASRVLDEADVFSRASRTEIERQLGALAAKRVDARLITINRLDYGVSLQQLGQQLVDRWSTPSGEDGSTATPLLLLLIDSQTKAAAVVAAPALQRQLPADLLRSTARTTMALPLREGDRYRQASLDGLQRLAIVLDGADDPGEPVIEDAAVVPTNIPTREETASSNAFTWVIVLLVVGTIVPMLTWWVFSR